MKVFHVPAYEPDGAAEILYVRVSVVVLPYHFSKDLSRGLELVRLVSLKLVYSTRFGRDGEVNRLLVEVDEVALEVVQIEPCPYLD